MLLALQLLSHIQDEVPTLAISVWHSVEHIQTLVSHFIDMCFMLLDGLTDDHVCKKYFLQLLTHVNAVLVLLFISVEENLLHTSGFRQASTGKIVKTLKTILMAPNHH